MDMQNAICPRDIFPPRRQTPNGSPGTCRTRSFKSNARATGTVICFKLQNGRKWNGHRDELPPDLDGRG
jgi:hypothetical protein